MISGRRVAIDVGTVRVGIAMSDASGIVASPLATIEPEELEDFLISLKHDESIAVLYVGLPLHLSGKEGASAAMAKATAAELKEVLGIPIRLLDERLTTVIATSRSTLKGERVDKTTIDQSAAVALLEFALQSERNSGALAGIEA
ncbi:MAG: Holliday junction resolvase RuvX [Actinomycetales bacterium]|jgi:putative Holliday junction resolvase|nr:Holliday junction resolvase RuvX [Actinomycetales bacterium]